MSPDASRPKATSPTRYCECFSTPSAGDDRHDREHDRDRNDPIDDRSPEQHSDRIDASGSKDNSPKGRCAHDAVETKRSTSRQLETARQTKGFAHGISGRPGKNLNGKQAGAAGAGGNKTARSAAMLIGIGHQQRD
jgi:hypothetical protein